jgi:hypothetical protein
MGIAWSFDSVWMHVAWPPPTTLGLRLKGITSQRAPEREGRRGERSRPAAAELGAKIGNFREGKEGEREAVPRKKPADEASAALSDGEEAAAAVDGEEAARRRLS